jgi:hypothetical protein
MDGARFDRLARTLSSRRTALGGVLGALVGGVAAALAGPQATVAHHTPRHCARKGQKARPK